MSEAKILKELLNVWIRFTDDHSDISLSNFSDYLNNSLRGETLNDSKDKAGELKMYFGYLLGRVINFTDLWGKLGFKELPILQFEDLAILREIEEKKNPAKNELVNLLVNEKSTVFEILKRLKRDQMIVDTIDETDRRVRRVSLTEYGEKVLEKSEIQAQKIAEVLVGNLSMDEILTLIKIFGKLDNHHTRLHSQKSYQNIDELIE